jgi:imidazolonepropionase-like amidohydrolase
MACSERKPLVGKAGSKAAAWGVPASLHTKASTANEPNQGLRNRAFRLETMSSEEILNLATIHAVYCQQGGVDSIGPLRPWPVPP